MQWLWFVLAGLAGVVALWPRPAAEALPVEGATGVVIPVSTQPSNVVVVGWQTAREKAHPRTADRLGKLRPLIAVSLVPLVWVGGLVFFYMNWIKFHANYIGEFLPPLALMAGLGAYLAWQRLHSHRPMWSWLPAGVFLVVLGWSAYLANYVTYTFEHTGTFDRSSAQEAAVWAKANIPLEEPIFTGAAVVPYLSGHHVSLDIAHPRWYAYEFTRKDTARLDTFLPSTAEMLTAYREAQWFLLDQQTAFSFLMEYSEIEAGLGTDWEKVHEVENLSNPLTFYRRIR